MKKLSDSQLVLLDNLIYINGFIEDNNVETVKDIIDFM
jgi:hypothetical protein